jgi:YD repeat-containing protein
LKVWDAGGKITTITSDARGRTTQVMPPAGPSVSYTYDDSDRLVSASRGGATTNISYDLAGRKLSMTDPDMGQWSYTYDALGKLSTQTDARGCITNLAYDPLNRLTGKTYSGACSSSPGVTYGYDNATNGIGRRTSMSTSGTGLSSTWTYDTRGRVTSEVKVMGTDQFKTMWSYNSADLVKTMTYPGGNAGQAGELVTSTYNRRMGVDGVSGSSTYVQSTTYDAAGRLDIRTLGSNQVKVDYDYYGWTVTNGLGRLWKIQAGTPGSFPNPSLQNLLYTYDAVGNVETILDKMNSDQKQCFVYDLADRLTKATTHEHPALGCSTQVGNGTYSENYQYHSETGNLDQKTGVGTYSYHATKKHAVISTTTSGWTFAYDANGNMTSRNIGTSYTLTYDAENKLKTVSATGLTAEYFYDGDSGRTEHGSG